MDAVEDVYKVVLAQLLDVVRNYKLQAFESVLKDLLLVVLIRARDCVVSDLTSFAHIDYNNGPTIVFDALATELNDFFDSSESH